MELDYLNFVASVRDDFSDTLTELSADLQAVGELADKTNRKLNLEVDVDDRELDQLQAELASTSAGTAAADPASPDGGGGSTTSTATSDGGGEDFLSTNDVRRLRDEFEDAFDESRFLRQGGQVSNWWDVMDERAFSDRLDFDADLDDLMGFQSLDIDDALDRFGDDRGPLNKFLNTISSGNFTMNTFYNIVARLIPLLATFVAALPAAIGGLTGLAVAGLGAGGGAATIAGLGALGFASERGMSTQEFTQFVMDELTSSFMDAFEPLGRQFSGVFEDALDGISTLFDEIAQRGAVLTKLRDEAYAFGSFVIDFLPTTLEKLARLGEATSGAFAALGAWFDDGDIIGGFAETMADTLPWLSLFASSFLTILPLIMDLSEGFLMVTSLLTALVAGMVDVLSVFQFFENVTGIGVETLGAFIGSLLILSGLLGATSLAMSALNVQMVLSAIRAIPSVVAGLQAFIVHMGIATTTTWSLALAVGVLTGGLALIAGGAALAASQFDLFGSKIDSATSSLREFGRVSGRIDDTSLSSGTSSFGGSDTVYIDYTDNSETTNEVSSQDEGVAVSAYQNYRSGSQLDAMTQ